MRLLYPLALIMFSGLAIPAFPQEKEADEEEKKPPDVIFKMGSDLSLFTKVSGSWKFADYEGKSVLRLAPEPIQESRIEMGAYLRSHNVGISAKVFSSQKRRIRSRMGVGLFGGNGFFLRLAPGRHRIELVQYGEVIAEAPLQWDSKTWRYLEFEVIDEETHWIVRGTSWDEEESKPELPTLEKKVYPLSLTHPLAGRAFLTGAPFGGYPILYDEVEVRSEAAKKVEK